MLSFDDLNAALNYDPETGTLTWKVRVNSKVDAGEVAGTVNLKGYVVVGFKGKLIYAHRVAFLLMTGSWPVAQVDHLNGLKSDNRWCNLRDVSSKANNQNLRKAKTGSVTGLLGVSPSPKGVGFVAQIRLEGKKVYLGTFDTAEEAHQKYLDSKRKSHEGCTL